LKAIQQSVATFEAQAEGAAAVIGALDFATVTETAPPQHGIDR
jgi:hypothetical protein